MYSENCGPNQPLGELERQQAANIQMLLNGALAAASYLQPGQTLDDLDVDFVMQDLLRRAQEY